MKSNSLKITVLALVFLVFTLWVTGQDQAKKPKEDTQCLTDIISEINKLESNRDPKCHATATRLENFMYGTPLAAETRFEKVKLQKQLLLHLWKEVSRSGGAGQSLVSRFKKEMSGVMDYSRKSNGDISIPMKGEPGGFLVLSSRDMDHYFSVAYALRAILAVQQEALSVTDVKLVSLDSDTIATLKEYIDVFTLAALQLSDRQARLDNSYAISPAVFRASWEKVQNSVTTHKFDSPGFWATANPAPAVGSAASPAVKFPTIFNVIQQKVKSYEVYNKISMQVFLRNLQVYFARHRWPSDQEEGQKFRNLFTRAMVDFSFEGLKYAEQVARTARHRFVREEDVHKMWNNFVPFEVDEYEDVTFFPRLERPVSIKIEAYDFDAFRDSGIHWRYLQFAMEDHARELSMEPDPFAAELLVEGIAQFGVLVLRIAGLNAKAEDAPRLKVSHLEAALKDIRDRIDRHAKLKPSAAPKEGLASSGGVTRLDAGKTYFTDVTRDSGIRFMHKSSDWLSRMLRSYLKKSENVGTLNVPPAFGGSGAAAGDVNGDGFQDVLLLSGAGNALYLGNGKGGFKDVTASAGIVFKRKDGNYGEPRQPVIADLDNDGHQDILITYVMDDHKLYRNRGNGTFEDVSAGSNLGGAGLVGGPAAAFDYDNDGLLDIYIAYFGDYPKGNLPKLTRDNLNALPNKLFKNMGGMQFKDVTETAGVGNTGWGQALAHTDLNLDGRQDIIVGNDFGVNVYYLNKGDGTFENIASKLGTDKPSFTMNVGITDLNRDRYPDIYISNIVTMVKDEKYVLPSADTTMKTDANKMARMRVVEANDLFLSHAENGKLNKYINSEAVGRGFSSTGWAWGANFFDFDNDGDDDLYCVNGMNEYSVYSDTPYYTKVFKEKREIKLLVYQKESNVFFVNEGGKLQNQSKQSGTDLLGNSRSTVYLDFDNDGDLDIVLNNYHGPAVVYRNNSQQLKKNWLMIKLTGDPAKKANRDAIGARIIAYKDGNQVAWREIRGGDGYLNVNPKIQHIGLGKLDTIDLTITWPNGDVTKLKDVKANNRYLLEQANGNLKQI